MSSKKNSLRLHPNWRERYASQLLNQRFSSMELYQIPTIMIYESMRYCLKTGRCLWLPWNLCTTDRRLAESSRNHFRNRRFLPIHRNFRFREICGLKTGSEKRSWSLDMILHGWKKNGIPLSTRDTRVLDMAINGHVQNFAGICCCYHISIAVNPQAMPGLRIPLAALCRFWSSHWVPVTRTVLVLFAKKLTCQSVVVYNSSEISTQSIDLSIHGLLMNCG